MPASLIERLKLTPLYRLYTWWQKRKSFEDWQREGIPVPPPPVVKQHTVRTYHARFGPEIFVETGTYLGEMVRTVKDEFEAVYTIEIDPALAEHARRKFSRYPHITVLEGDSGVLLPEVLGRIERRALFWLDSHYSGGLTGRGMTETPIERELAAIFSHHVRDHVILIDDARNFTGGHDYPPLDAVRLLVERERPGWIMEVEHDIIRIHPPLEE